MNDEGELDYEEIRRQLIEKLRGDDQQYVNEVAMPGILRPVNAADAGQ